VARVQNRLADILHVQGRTKEAEYFFQDGLRRQRAYPSQRMALAAMLDDYTANQIALGRLEQAKSLAAEALALREAILPPVHPTIARTLGNLSSVAWQQAQFAEALRLIRRSSDIALSQDKPDAGAAYRYQLHVRAAWWEAFGSGRNPSKDLLNEAFIVA